MGRVPSNCAPGPTPTGKHLEIKELESGCRKRVGETVVVENNDKKARIEEREEINIHPTFHSPQLFSVSE